MEPKPILFISNSDANTFQRCKRKWNLQSFNRRNLIPKIPNLKFWIGTGCHYALERWHGYGEDPVITFALWSEKQIAEIKENVPVLPPWYENELLTMQDLGIHVLDHYKKYAETYIVPKYKFLHTEYEFAVPIPNTLIQLTDWEGNVEDWVIKEWGTDYSNHPQFISLYVSKGLYNDVLKTIPALFVGRLDALVQDDNGAVWVMDHKFLASMPDDELLALDSQTAKYVWAIQIAIQNGWFPGIDKDTVLRGALYNVARKKIPRIPDVLKNGSTSKNKSIDTTYEIFKSTLISRGENPKDYVDVLLHLRNKGNTFFKLKEIIRSEDELYWVGARLQYEWQDMNLVGSRSKDIMHPALYPTSAPNCVWACPFKKICIAANGGVDAEYIIETTMMTQERRDLYATQVEDYEVDP